MTAPDQQKHDAFEGLLDSGHNVTIHLRPGAAGVTVPERFRAEASLGLTLGYNLAKPIPDLTVETDGVSGTLSFGGVPEWIFVPWSALWGMAAPIGSVVWPDDMPEGMALGKERGGAAPAAAPGGAEVIDLMARRSPKDRRACQRRLKLTAPRPQPAPGGGDAA